MAEYVLPVGNVDGHVRNVTLAGPFPLTEQEFARLEAVLYSMQPALTRPAEAVVSDGLVEAILDAGDTITEVIDDDAHADAATVEVTAGDVMRACGRLTAIERLDPGVPLARELNIPGSRVAPYIRMARARGWLPHKIHADGTFDDVAGRDATA